MTNLFSLAMHRTSSISLWVYTSGKVGMSVNELAIIHKLKIWVECCGTCITFCNFSLSLFSLLSKMFLLEWFVLIYKKYWMQTYWRLYTIFLITLGQTKERAHSKYNSKWTELQMSLNLPRFFVGFRPKLHFVKLNGQNCLGIGIGGGFGKALRW